MTGLEMRIFAGVLIGIAWAVMLLLMHIDEKLQRINNQLGQMLDPETGRFARIIDPVNEICAEVKAVIAERMWREAGRR